MLSVEWKTQGNLYCLRSCLSLILTVRDLALYHCWSSMSPSLECSWNPLCLLEKKLNSKNRKLLLTGKRILTILFWQSSMYQWKIYCYGNVKIWVATCSYFMEKKTDMKRDELNDVTQEICVKVGFRIGIPWCIILYLNLRKFSPVSYL